MIINNVHREPFVFEKNADWSRIFIKEFGKIENIG